MSSAEISERIALLTDAYQECLSQIDRLAQTAGIGTEVARSELAALIHQTLKEGESELEILSLKTSALSPTRDPQAALQAALLKLKDDFKNARVSYRKSLLTSKRKSDLLARQERDLLFSSSLTSPTSPTSPSGTATPPRRRPHTPKPSTPLSADDMLASSSTSVTLALRRTHALLTSELSRSQFAQETLAESTATLKQLSKSYGAFDSLLYNSRALITDLVKRNKSDHWYYSASLYVLVGTIVWLIFRRLLWGPVWLMFWVPLKISVWVLGTMFGVVLGGKRNTEVGGKDEVGIRGGSVESVGTVTSFVGVKGDVTSVLQSLKSIQSKGVDNVKSIVSPEHGIKKVTLDNGEVVEVQLDPVEYESPAVDLGNSVEPLGSSDFDIGQESLEDDRRQVEEVVHDEL